MLATHSPDQDNIDDISIQPTLNLSEVPHIGRHNLDITFIAF